MKIKCPNCGWVGDNSQLKSDFCDMGCDESYCDSICPLCEIWQDEEDYEIVHDSTNSH